MCLNQLEEKTYISHQGGGPRWFAAAVRPPPSLSLLWDPLSPSTIQNDSLSLPLSGSTLFPVGAM